MTSKILVNGVACCHLRRHLKAQALERCIQVIVPLLLTASGEFCVADNDILIYLHDVCHSWRPGVVRLHVTPQISYALLNSVNASKTKTKITRHSNRCVIFTRNCAAKSDAIMLWAVLHYWCLYIINCTSCLYVLALYFAVAVFQGEAQGDLYIDDYDQFDYQQGRFTMRHFSLANNKLKNM